METFRKIAIVLFALALASCSKPSIVGTWSQIEENENGEGKDLVTLIETFLDDGSYKGELMLQDGKSGLGGNLTTSGSYEVIGDSVIIYNKKVIVMGQETPIKGDGRKVRKIIELDNETLIYAIDGKQTKMKRIEIENKK